MLFLDWWFHLSTAQPDPLLEDIRLKDKFYRFRTFAQTHYFLSKRALLKGGFDFEVTNVEDESFGPDLDNFPSDTFSQMNADFSFKFEYFLSSNLSTEAGFTFRFFEQQQRLENNSNTVRRTHFDQIDFQFGFNYFISSKEKE